MGEPDATDTSGTLPAERAYRIRILPAGKNDKVIEVSDMEGNVIKFLHSYYRLGNATERREVEQVRHDWQTLDATDFARKYGLTEEPGS